jgi:hypothetical protein
VTKRKSERQASKGQLRFCTLEEENAQEITKQSRFWIKKTLDMKRDITLWSEEIITCSLRDIGPLLCLDINTKQIASFIKEN